MPLPRHVDAPPRKTPRFRTAIVTYDLRTRFESRGESPGQAEPDAGAGGPTSGEIPGSPGLWLKEGEESVVQPDNFTGLSVVPDPSAGDYAKHVKLFISWPDGDGSGCSGTLIDPYHVVTAGHCAHQDAHGGWATSITVIPAYEDGDRPFGDATAVQLHSWAGWTDGEDFDDDVALIDLDRPVGALTGWRGYGWSDDCSYYTGGSWVHNGYPGDPPYDGQFMYTQTGDFDDCETDPIFGFWYGNEVSYDRYSWGGQSGTGAVRSNTVRAVLSNGDSDTTWDVKITEGKFGDIQSFLNTDRPAAFDLIPLTVSLTPGTITSGRRLTDLDFAVHNYGDAAVDADIAYDVYLSANNNISTADILMASGTFHATLGARGSMSVDANVLPLIPAATASGDYFVGVILDVADASTANNDTDGQDAAPLSVDYCAPLLEPALTSPANAATCLDFPITLNWSDVVDADGYILRVGDACGAGTDYDIPAGSVRIFYAGSLAANTTYYWRVIAKNACGNFSLWTPCRSFTTGPGTPGAATLQDPLDAASCIGSAVTLNWLPIANAVSYDVQLGTACGLGSIVSRNFSDYDAVGLAASTTYYWRVRGKNSCNDLGSWSPCFSFTTAPPIAAMPVLNSPADGATCLGVGTVLDWDDVPGAAIYQVQVHDICGPLGGLMVFAPESRLDLFAAGPPPAGEFFWRVRAGNGCGSAGPWSACFRGTIDITRPGAAGNVQSASHVTNAWSTDRTIDVTWTAPSGEACGMAGYSTVWDSSATTIPDETAEVPTPSTTSPARLDGQQHFFHLRPVDGAGNGSFETAVMHLGPFWIDATAPPVAVLTPNGGESWAGGSVQTIQWTASDAASGVAGLEVLYSVDGGGTWASLVVLGPGAVAYDWTLPAAESADARVRVVATDAAGNVGQDESDAAFAIVVSTDVGSGRPPVTAYTLAGNVPNPFNPRTTIRFALPEPAHVSVRIFDLHGRLVRVLVDGLRDGPAWHEAVWDGLADGGQAVASGVYFYRLEAAAFTQTRRMVLVR